MGPHCVHHPRSLSHFSARVHLQEAGLALLPVRSMLLCDDSKFRLFLDLSIKSGIIRGLLLSLAWLPCWCCYNLEK